MKLTVEAPQFTNFGYTAGNFELILRQGKNTHLNATFGEHLIFPANLSNFLPMGNPPHLLVGYVYTDTIGYFSYFQSSDIAAHLTLTTKNQQFTHPIFLIESLLLQFTHILQTAESVDSIVLQCVPDTDYDVSPLTHLTGLDSFMYSVFTKRKILLIGETTEVLALLKAIIALIPDKYRKYFGISINIPIFYDDVVFYYITDALPDYESQVQQFLDSGGDFLNLNEHAFFGEFSCDLVQKLAKSLPNENVFAEKINELLEQIQAMDESVDLDTIANNLNINYADAEFIFNAKKATIRRHD